ncbi:MAG TPA: UDP-N-acetylmuramoyl-tripeptide--D-alanyl-D-alanine ligase [Clostridia bacterium]|nr:UDP-N-acetylmuramoyl-tripeptide--D-alanyl-D-alanine ligase [Clostridia bacterium]
MASFTIGQIIEATGGEILNHDPSLLNTKIHGVSTDTRKVKKRELFIPLVGDLFDGHAFIDRAVKKGAGAILSHLDETEYPYDIPVIKVGDTLKALQDLAYFHRNRFNIPIIGITGSNGKTTTKDMVASVLSKEYDVLKTEGNLNNEIGLPLTLLRLEDKHQVGVIEMGMSDLGEIRRLAQIASPTIAVITNIGVSHIENLATRENILKAKKEIFDYFTHENVGILNGDDELLATIEGKLPFKIIYYGTKDGMDLKANNIGTLGGKGVSYDLEQDGERVSIELGIPGKHNVYNSMVVVAIGMIMGMDMYNIIDGLKAFRTGEMRLNIFTTTRGITVIDDVYNASPDPMKATIEILKDLGNGRRIAILGDMLELGSYSEEAHLDVGKFVVNNQIDILITLGNESRLIGEGAKISGMDTECIIHKESNKDVIELLDTILNQDDIILVKGSRGMKMEEIVDYLKKRGTDR